MTRMTSNKAGKILRLPEVLEYTGLSRSTIYGKCNPRSSQYDSTFPQRISLGSHSVGWDECQLRAWLDTRQAPNSELRPRLDRRSQDMDSECSEDRRPIGGKASHQESERAPRADTPPEIQIEAIRHILEKDWIEKKSLVAQRAAIVLQRLEKSATSGERLFYKDVMVPVMLSPDVPDDLAAVDEILADISRKSHTEKGVLLSVLVCERPEDPRRSPLPNKAFFALAESLGYAYTNPWSFVDQQIRRLFDVYNPPTRPYTKTIWMDIRGRQPFLTRI